MLDHHVDLGLANLAFITFSNLCSIFLLIWNFQIGRLNQCVIEQSCILEADWINKILQNPFEHYKEIINATYYAKILEQQKNIDSKIGWYLKKMSGKTVAYILSVNIHVTKTNLKKHWALAHLMGKPLTGAKKVEEFDDMI